MLDIFIDTNRIQFFTNPVLPEYIKLISWLKEKGSLVLTNKLLTEYGGGCQHISTEENIMVLIDFLQQQEEDRINFITNSKLGEFKIKKKDFKNIRSKKSDIVHLKSVLISHRRLALTDDQNLTYDINNYPGYRGIAKSNPNDLPYE